MIEFVNFDYKKEYRELIETFIPKAGNRGQIFVFSKLGNYLKINVESYSNKIEIDNYFSKEESNIKRTIYKLLREYFKEELLWGMLVGVNPLKLFLKLEKEFGLEKSKEILREGYFVSSEKINLGFEILDNQKPIRKELEGKQSIYIDIPFCPSRCSYCSYSTYKVNDDLVEKYLKKLTLEMEKVSKNINIKPQNIYIGGGTPSSIGRKNLEKLLNSVFANWGRVEEITVEIGRPDTINSEILKTLKSFEVDRISINPQTMNDKTLKILGRNHTSEEVIESFSLARGLGFNNINADLIIGLPQETHKHFQKTLERIKILNPESLSIHALALKKGSKLAESGFENEGLFEFQKIRNGFVEKENYLPYYLYRQKNMFLNIENIGYSKLGMECKYNVGMMEDIQDVIGFGLDSTTKIINKNKIIRHMNFRTLSDYFKYLDKNIDDKIELLEGKSYDIK